MRSFVAVATALTSFPVAAAAAQDDQTITVTNSERRICTRLELRGASRISYQRVCRTPAEWRQRLGPDWRQLLAGNNSVEDDMDKMETLGGGGRTSGGVGGFRARGPR